MTPLEGEVEEALGVGWIIHRADLAAAMWHALKERRVPPAVRYEMVMAELWPPCVCEDDDG